MWALISEMKFIWISIAGKQDSNEDSNNLKIDERKEEKETASSFSSFYLLSVWPDREH